MPTPLVVSDCFQDISHMHLRRRPIRLGVVGKRVICVRAGSAMCWGGDRRAPARATDPEGEVIYGNYATEFRPDHRPPIRDRLVDMATLVTRAVMDVRWRGRFVALCEPVPERPGCPRVSGASTSSPNRSLPRGHCGDAPATRGKGICSSRLNLVRKRLVLAGCRPATFSGGEQQRVNVASDSFTDHPILLLDERRLRSMRRTAGGGESLRRGRRPVRPCSASFTMREMRMPSPTGSST